MRHQYPDENRREQTVAASVVAFAQPNILHRRKHIKQGRTIHPGLNSPSRCLMGIIRPVELRGLSSTL